MTRERTATAKLKKVQNENRTSKKGSLDESQEDKMDGWTKSGFTPSIWGKEEGRGRLGSFRCT